MKINVQKIRIFKMCNRKGYAALCLNHLTEGRTLFQVYDRMLKALRRSSISIKRPPLNIKRLLKKNI